MARDQSGSAHPSPEDRQASVRAGRKRLGENGYPQPAPERLDTADRTGLTATGRPDTAAKGPAGAA